MFFIRDDDVCTLDEAFRVFFKNAIDYQVPVIYAVIPGKMEKDLIRFLCHKKEEHPDLIDIVQHGWMHLNYSSEKKVKYEFGPSRSPQNQREDIQRGLLHMKQAFGDLFTPVFVPPFHGYDDTTLEILAEERVLGFSAGDCSGVKGVEFVLLPARISFSRYDETGVTINSARMVMKELIRESSYVPLSGIVTHHSDFKGPESREQLIRFFELLYKFRNFKGQSAFLFSQFIKI